MGPAESQPISAARQTWWQVLTLKQQPFLLDPSLCPPVHTWRILGIFKYPKNTCAIFGIPEIRDHLYRKWQRDGCLRLAAQAHVTVCYGWAVGQSQCSRDRALTWLALDRRWQDIKISFPWHRWNYLELFATFLLILRFSLAYSHHIVWLRRYNLIITNTHRLIHALNTEFSSPISFFYYSEFVSSE